MTRKNREWYRPFFASRYHYLFRIEDAVDGVPCECTEFHGRNDKLSLIRVVAGTASVHRLGLVCEFDS